MKPETRRELLEALVQLWQQHPHWRFGQLVCNAADWADVSVWDIEDEQLLDALRGQQAYQQSITPTPSTGDVPS